MSSQVTTLVSSINEMTMSAAVVAFTSSPRKIHSTRAITTRIASVISRWVSGPIFSSSFAAQLWTSAPSFTSGG